MRHTRALPPATTLACSTLADARGAHFYDELGLSTLNPLARCPSAAPRAAALSLLFYVLDKDGSVVGNETTRGTSTSGNAPHAKWVQQRNVRFEAATV